MGGTPVRRVFRRDLPPRRRSVTLCPGIRRGVVSSSNGLLDLVWHSIYGFDAVAEHARRMWALFLSISITIDRHGDRFSPAARRAALGGGRIGVVAPPIPILMLFRADSRQPPPEQTSRCPVNPVVVGIVLFSPLAVRLSAPGFLANARAAAVADSGDRWGTLQAAPLVVSSPLGRQRFYAGLVGANRCATG